MLLSCIVKFIDYNYRRKMLFEYIVCIFQLLTGALCPKSFISFISCVSMDLVRAAR